MLIGERIVPVIVNWKTSEDDGREHAVPDDESVALCGHRVVERCCSMLDPAGRRCERCDQLRRARP
jgi:hypothetical protein